MEKEIVGGSNNVWSSVLFIITVVFVILLEWRIMDRIWVKPKKMERMLKQQGFKGNPYSLTTLLFGDVKGNSMEDHAQVPPKPPAINIHDEAVPRLLPLVHKTIQQYGKMSFVWVGSTPQLLIVDPELTKTVLTKYNTFRKNVKVTNNIVQALISGILSEEGEEWRKSRKTQNHSFQLEKIKQLIPAFQVSCDEIVSEWKKSSKDGDGSCTVDVVSHIEALTTKIVSRTLFATDHAQDKIVYKILRDMTVMARYETTRLDNLPGAKYLPMKTNRRLKQMKNEIRKSLTKLINERAKAIKAGETMEDNFLHVLLKSEVAEESHGMIKNMDDLIGQIQLYYAVGYESTTSTIIWTMILLSMHQDWQERARQEVFQVFGDRKPDYEGLSQLKIVAMILNEVLRLYPPVVELSRVVDEETKLGEYTIPADTQIMLPIIMLQRDTQVWGEDANEFKPDRFAEGVLKASNGHPAFFPFGSGPRICIGQSFALLEAKLVMANILSNFSFELAPTYTHAPYLISTLQPQYDAPLIMRNL